MTNFRISDQERNRAMSALGEALGEGRLKMEEFDRRCDLITQSETRRDLEAAFIDLPQKVEKYYPASHIERVRRDGARPKLGILSLTTVFSVAGLSISGSGVWLLAIPTVFILLYIMQIGPASWHTPSTAQLERARLRELKAERKAIAAQRRDDVYQWIINKALK